jgi:hypothetical protein
MPTSCRTWRLWHAVLVCIAIGSAAKADVIALKRDAGLLGGGAIDARFQGATVVTTTVDDSPLYSAQDSRWFNGGRALKSDSTSYTLYRFDLTAVPGLAYATISKAQLRIYHTMGNSGGGGVGIVLTHNWIEGTKDYSCPGAAGGVSYAHPMGYNTQAHRNAADGTTEPLQSWGVNRDGFFSSTVDMGPVTNPSSAPVGQGFHVIDVTSHVQAWVRGIYPNFGWAQPGGNWDFHLSESGSDYQPVLFIDYSHAGDTTPPAAVADLAAGDATPGSVTLTWTAPGDDGTAGTAASYDIRYSTNPISEATWGAALAVGTGPAPQPAGTVQSTVVTGLAADTTYYFAMKSRDEVPNVSAISNVVSAHTPADVVPPATVTDLAAINPGNNNVTLTWTAPGDDGTVGTAAAYDIRYSTSAITEANWAAAVQVTGEPPPAAPGTRQSTLISNLTASTLYYFALKTYDEAPNASGLSNVVSARTIADTVAPAAVANLAVAKAKSRTLTLTWTAPGDDGNTGAAASYDIRYSTHTINEGNWAGATQVTGEPAPAPAGTVQGIVIADLRPNTTYYVAIRTFDEASNLSDLSNVPAGQTLPTSPLNRPIIRQDDFEYLGAFRLPTFACGYTTAFGETGITLRRVGGNLRVLTGSHRYSGDAIYECTFPGWGTVQGSWPQSTIIREWGAAVYGTPSMKPSGSWTHGVNYDAATGRLYYSFAPGYHIAQTNDPSLGYAQLEEAGPVASGPWSAPSAVAHCQKIRGGSLTIPDWFAEGYLAGRKLGLGFGGYYSGFASCSKGPFLAAAHHPDGSTTQLDTLVLIDHPDDHWGTRDADYSTTITWCRNPADGVGFWGARDEIYGGAAWIDLPDKQGVLFLSRMGHGNVWYDLGLIFSDRTDAWWWVYDPADLADVAQGQKPPWEPQHEFWKMNYTPRQAEVMTPGCAFDAETRTLFVLVPYSYKVNVWEQTWYPLVHGYRVKESFQVGDINKDGVVDAADLLSFADAFGSAGGGSHYDVRCDLNANGYVDVSDLLMLAGNWEG